VEACRLGGGNRGERATQWRRPRWVDCVAQASGTVERRVGKAGNAVEAEHSREILLASERPGPSITVKQTIPENTLKNYV